MHINTKLLHGYAVIDEMTGAASIPKYQTSTFHNKKLYCDEQAYFYTRFANPTIDALEEGLSALQASKYALAFSSGMAAISNVLMLLNAGEHLILPKDVYGGTCQFVTQIIHKYNIATTFVNMSDLAEVEAAIKPNTRMIYMETPSNPLLKIVDIRAIVEIAQRYQLITVADNTFMTSLYQQPLTLGVDIVVESMTKFINGHSDVVAGVVATNDLTYYEELKLFQKNFGAILGVEDAWLILRGMKTMGLRMEKSIANASKMAEFLNHHPKIKAVYYPGLATHASYEVHQSQAQQGGAVLSFVFNDHENMLAFTSKIKLPILAVSLGGVESILSHPATMSHGALSEEEKQSQGIVNELLRLSCGIEDVEDLIEDFKQALT